MINRGHGARPCRLAVPLAPFRGRRPLGREPRLPDLAAQLVQFAQLSNQISSRVGNDYDASLERTHENPQPTNAKAIILDEKRAAATSERSWRQSAAAPANVSCEFNISLKGRGDMGAILPVLLCKRGRSGGAIGN